jgi:hypothetical protein
MQTHKKKVYENPLKNNFFFVSKCYCLLFVFVSKINEINPLQQKVINAILLKAENVTADVLFVFCFKNFLMQSI